MEKENIIQKKEKIAHAALADCFAYNGIESPLNAFASFLESQPNLHWKTDVRMEVTKFWNHLVRNHR